MLSIVILIILLGLCFWGMKRSKKKGIRYAALVFLNLLVIECVVYGYFMLLVLKGTCFFLIGNQFALDNLIQLRLVRAIYYSQGKKSFIHQVDNVSGYTLGADKVMALHKTNKQGFRGNREYALLPEEDKLRFAAFGDSFVFCAEEANNDTWPYYLEKSVNNLEVLNFGVPGYGLTQIFIRFQREGLKFNPDIIFFNYVVLGRRDKANPFAIIEDENLRQAHFYRAHFELQDGILVSKATSPYDLFDENYRKEHLYKKMGINLDDTIWGRKEFSFSNITLLIKTVGLKKYIIKHAIKNKDPERMTQYEEAVNVALLRALLRTAKNIDATVLFFYKLGMEELPCKNEPAVGSHPQ